MEEAEEDESGISVMGLRDKLGYFEGGKVSGIEVRVGLTTGVGIISLREDSGVVLDDLMAAVCLEARSVVCPSWRRRHYPSDVEPLIEWKGAKGAVSMVGWLHRTSQRLRQDVDCVSDTT